MNGDSFITGLFLFGGLLLLGSEFITPSFVAGFLGIAAVIVGGLHAIGVVDGLWASTLSWAALSVLLTLALRPIARRWLRAESRRDDSDEDRDAFDTIVDVISTIDDSSDQGRIRFQGSTWSATSTRGTIEKGHRARIVYRDKLVWIVEPVDALTEAHVVPPIEERDGANPAKKDSGRS